MLLELSYRFATVREEVISLHAVTLTIRIHCLRVNATHSYTSQFRLSLPWSGVEHGYIVLCRVFIDVVHQTIHVLEVQPSVTVLEVASKRKQNLRCGVTQRPVTVIRKRVCNV